MAFNLQDFKSRGLTFHGARPTLFKVEINNVPSGISGRGLNKVSLMCRATQLPPAIVESIPVGYFGRDIKVSGDRTFPDWTVSIINDEDFLIRDMMENWSVYQNSMVENIREGLDYKQSAIITQYGKGGNILKEYEMVGIFPTTVGPIELSWDNKNQIEMFDTTFALDWWEPLGSNGNGF
jgi:hypothetical protein